MSNRTLLTLPVISILFTFSVWAWILTRPAGTFHDQGGLTITLFYFPATFVLWFMCALPSLVRRRSRIRSLEAETATTKLSRHGTLWLIGLGLFLSIETLFLA
jgi:hypothetical protein